MEVEARRRPPTTRCSRRPRSGVKAGEGASAEDEILICLVAREGCAPDPAALLDWCDERMPYFAVPRYVRVLDHLPKTPTERVRKVELRDAGVTRGHVRPRRVSDDLDLGEAADYILSERPGPRRGRRSGRC